MSNKTRKWRSAIAMVLVICMLFSIFPVAAFADTTSGGVDVTPSVDYDIYDINRDGTVNYVALGDSMTNGYGTAGYYPAYNNVEDGTYMSHDQLEKGTATSGENDNSNKYGYKMNAKDAYPTLVADEMNWTLTNLAISGMRPEELRVALVGDTSTYAGDAYTQNVFLPAGGNRFAAAMYGIEGYTSNSDNDNDSVAKINEEYVAAITKADIISINLGTNNFGTVVTTNLYALINGEDVKYDVDVDALLAETPELQEYYNQAYDEVLAALEDAGVGTGMIAPMMESLMYGLIGFIQNYDASVNLIREINPDALLVIVGLNNPLEDVTIDLSNMGMGTLPLGDIMERVIDFCNVYMAALEGDGLDAIFADVEAVEPELMVEAMGEGEFNAITEGKLVHGIVEMADQEASVESLIIALLNAGALTDDDSAIQNVTNQMQQTNPKSGTANPVATAWELYSSVRTAVIEAAAIKDLSGKAVEVVFGGSGLNIDMADLDNPATQAILHVYARALLAEGIGIHPSENGHATYADVIVTAIENGYTGKDFAKEKLNETLNDVKDVVVEYYDEAYAYAYAYAAENGYIKDATNAIDDVIAELENIKAAVEHSDSEMTEAFKAELIEQINDVIDVLEEAKDLIEEADVLDQETLDALMELLGEAGEMMTQLGITLNQAGVDVTELAIVPALEEAYEVLKNEVVPAIVADLEEAIAEGTAWLMDKAQEAIDALVDALPGMAQYAHDYVLDFLLNNPEEVIAFFNEYGDEIIDVVGEYGPYALAAMGYIADNYGQDILNFVIENQEEILEVTAMLIKEHGPHAVQLIQVYADALGLCDMIQDEIDKIEDQIADLKDQLENELKKQLEDLKAELEDLYEQLENASDEVKAQIQKAIEEVEKLIAEVEKAIAEIEAAIADLEAQLAEAQKALEEAIAAVEAVVNAIKEAIDNGITTVEEILEVIADVVEFAKDTIAGVQTAIDGIVKAVEDVVDFVDELIANGIVAAEMIEEIIDTVMDIIDGVKAELEKGDIEAAIEAIRNELTNGYEELSAMLAAIDTAIAEQLDAIVGDLEAALAQAQDEFEEALYNATHGEIACDAKIFAVGGNTATAAGGYADILVADERWNLTEAENIDGADVILYQADPQKFSKALKAGLVNAFAAVLEKELNPSMADFVLGQLELEKTDAPNWNAYITDENAMAYFEQAKADLVNELAAEYGEDVAELMSPVIDTVMYAVVGYAIENIATIESLSEANEDALIVAVGMYNPVQGMTVTIGGEEIDIEALCQYLIEVTDVYNLLYAIAAQNAVFVDVSEAETNAVGNVDVDKIIALDGDEFDNVLNVLAALDSNYANADGHAYIAAQILDAIDVVHDGGCPECEVKDIPVTGVTLNTTEATMTTGSSLQLVATVLPENATNKAVTWESDDEDLITVDENGLVTSYSTTGSAYIIVTTEDGNYTAECEVTVEEKPIDYVAVTGVTLDEEAITLIAAGETQTLTATVEPSDATDKSVIWTSSNPEVATVVNGVVTAVANGEAIITVTTANGGYTDTCSVTVNIPTGTETVSVTGVALDKDTLSLKVGNTAALTATVTPDNATNKAVTWASSDESIATVADGVVTAVAKGTATITVTTVDGGFTDTCAVTVTKASSGGFGGGGGGAYTKAKPEVIVPDNAVPAGVTVTADYADYQTVNGAQDFAAKDNNIAVIGGRDSSAEVIVKPAGAVDTFTHPVQLVVPVSKSALQNVDDVNKLTLALVTTDAQGNIQLTYVGGNYDASKGTFTAYVNQPGKYVLVEKLDLVKIELTIDRYVIFVNGEPIINDVPSRIVNNRTLAPAARVLHHMGCTVEWLSDTRTVAVTLPNGDVLNLPVDEPIPGFGAAPVIENGRTLVPIAYIADMMDAHVQWVGNDRKVIIVK